MLAIGDIAKVPPALHLARMAKRLATKVVVYTNGASDLLDQAVAALGNDPVITFDNRRVVRLEKVKEGSSEIIVHLSDGTSVSQAFIVSASISKPLSFGIFHLTEPNIVYRSTSQRTNSMARLRNSSI